MSEDWGLALDTSMRNVVPNVDRILEDHPYIRDYAAKLSQTKRHVLDHLDEYVKLSMESVVKSGGVPHMAKDASEAQALLGRICGEEGVVLFAKSNVALELGLRESLARDGHEVWETDLGEFLVQLAQDAPSHIVAPALHMTKERIGRILHDRLDPGVSPDSTYEELVASVRAFLFRKYAVAKVGVTGANAVAAATGSVLLVENEGNIRMDTVVPRIHVAVTGVDKIVPTLEDAFMEVQVQSAFAGLYPPTYINITSGPSYTADIESRKVTPATGPREFHLVFVDNGRKKAIGDPALRDALLCVKCGRCYFACPTYGVLGSDWMAPPYGGPVGAMWAAVLNDDTRPANMCTHSGGCKVVCPVQIDIPRVLEHVKWLGAQKTR